MYFAGVQHCSLDRLPHTKRRVNLTPVSVRVFNALSHGSIGLAFHGTFNSSFFIFSEGC